jgi:hypothetical protein
MMLERLTSGSLNGVSKPLLPMLLAYRQCLLSQRSHLLTSLFLAIVGPDSGSWEVEYLQANVVTGVLRVREFFSVQVSVHTTWLYCLVTWGGVLQTRVA